MKGGAAEERRGTRWDGNRDDGGGSQPLMAAELSSSCSKLEEGGVTEGGSLGGEGYNEGKKNLIRQSNFMGK